MASLYRSCLRAIRRLPDPYLREFFRLKFSDEFRDFTSRKVPRIQREIKKINSANAGNVPAFEWALNYAYGRSGKLRRELLEQLRLAPSKPLALRIIPALERSRPPVYSDELTALLTSGTARPTRAMTKKDITTPPTLPLRADPTSEDYRLLGPLSKRRNVNIRWKYFTDEISRLWLPLESSGETRIRNFGFEGVELQEHVERIAGPVQRALPITRKEREAGVQPILVPRSQTSRWVRRRYRTLLGKIPRLTFIPDTKPHLPEQTGKPSGRYEVSLPTAAISASLYRDKKSWVAADNVAIAWLDKSRSK
ncbi:hypothetical protein C8J56DRAFT_298968 [Mycena floridula]|nr:hypothetical protein C8J56DRAFT_298968 [Mycena floridula]